MESGDDELTVTGSLVDERPRRVRERWGSEPPRVIHHMRVTLRVRSPDLTLAGAEGGLDRAGLRELPASGRERERAE